MSYRPGKNLTLSGVDYSTKSPDQLQELFRQTLEEGMHGLCYSAYEEGQKPGDLLIVEQVRRRMGIIAPYTKWVRSFSCIEGNELVPQVAREFGLKTLVGAWLGKDKDLNEQEIAGLIALAQNGKVDIAAVGNEVMYRKDLTEDELLGYLHRVKDALPGVPVGYVDAYYEFSHRPKITEACDVILANCYPFWEGCAIDYSLVYMKQMYQQAVQAGNGKRVIITETGWPSKGQSLQGAVPSAENAMKYFINAQLWTREAGIDCFYFASFDEAWKVGAEGDVGAYWGLWDMHENLKF
ncbi:MAG TPA: glycosyl hydrolase family 17 protein [Flavilitoribacter sp.]|nr:glycosyl hydrolase family 17 protein [Flavilitoribacter sp.]HMQ86320.1 glycosyl hydrolase family 17 protein [Flavilitoribacter sp.]